MDTSKLMLKFGRSWKAMFPGDISGPQHGNGWSPLLLSHVLQRDVLTQLRPQSRSRIL